MFKGPESTPISTMELRRIKVDIRRNIPAQASVTELHRDIVAPEDVIVKRRDGKIYIYIFFSLNFLIFEVSVVISEIRLLFTALHHVKKLFIMIITLLCNNGDVSLHCAKCIKKYHCVKLLYKECIFYIEDFLKYFRTNEVR